MQILIKMFMLISVGDMISLLMSTFIILQHDTTVAALLSAMGVFNDISPPYAAMAIVELYQNTSGSYFVKLYYKNSTTNSSDMLSLTLPSKYCSEP